MHPILFEVGGFTIYSYGVLLAAAYLLGLQFALNRARRRGLNPQHVMDLGIWIILGALIGAKLLLFVVDFRQFTASPRELLDLVRSGGVFYGGLIGGGRGMVFDVLSTSQFVSVILVALAIAMLVLLSRRTDPTGHAAAQRVAA